MTNCTTPDCGQDATLYICNQCINDLQAWLSKCAEILPELDDTIARLDNVRVSNNEGGNGSRSAGSSAPLNLDAMQLKINLASLTQTAEHYAKDQHAAGIAWTIQDWYTKAELLISGPEEDAPSEISILQAREKLDSQFPEPLPPRDCATWLRENAGIKIAGRTINDWHHRGKIRKHPGSTPKRPLYSAKEVLAVHMTRQHE
ncbi:hypothetical protein [Glutamicibacter sp. ZJUTW]|uniref:hypothetical protein n=1 Tax=Glutamicibacter sp. ZJUTW TaxID=1155384 RepID=UPI0011F34E95|nr:hypothetical protein [Glutamicibacter sp. ZJUTW]QEP06176.1 hypothetical protein F0M17_02335 [Glutamicibacter sp. ZJUTW]